jgi:hypothetical protein
MGDTKWCVGTLRVDSDYYLFNMNPDRLKDGPVARYTEQEYAERYQRARGTNVRDTDPVLMFPDGEAEGFSVGELEAYAGYLGHKGGVLRELGHGALVIAYQNTDLQTYAPEPTRTPAAAV